MGSTVDNTVPVAGSDEHVHHHHHHHEDVDLGDSTWRDGKRYAWLLGIFVPLTPFLGWAAVEASGFGGFWYLAPFVVFVVFPLLDLAIGADPVNPPDSVLMWLEQDRYYRWITYAFIPVQYAGLVFACWQWSHGGLAVWESIGLALTIGVVGGVAINTAHELGHKRESMERWLSRIALAQTGYGHFFIEHNRGHHVRVATPEDPASARMGESFWFFLPRTVIGSLRSAWGIETARLDRLEASRLGPKNDIVTAWAMTALLFAALAVIFGPVVLPYLALQAVIGFCLLESVNYLEHYGLLRQRLDNGRYERCRAEHSWNNNNVASNVLLFHLQRHSDHHAHPTRRYQALRAREEAPQLPTGYAGMVVLAWCTPLWRRVMDPRLLAHYDGDLTRVNLSPGARQRLVSRYGKT